MAPQVVGMKYQKVKFYRQTFYERNRLQTVGGPEMVDMIFYIEG